MSLFVCKEWWISDNDRANEECGHGCMYVGNIDNSQNGKNKIVVGAYSGLLRVYLPNNRGFSLEDLLLETQLSQPILALNAGRYVSGQQNIALAVLHPRTLVVYSIIPNFDGTGAVRYLELEKRYEHRLDRTACNFIHGRFGGVQDSDYICVQSMDGQLSFFEHESFAFSRQLPDTILPGSLCYVQATDSILVSHSTMTITSYKYHTLGAEHRTTTTVNRDEPKGLHGAPTLRPQWTRNVGEHICEMRVLPTVGASNDTEILALGEHTIFNLTTNGVIRTQKRVEYNPSTCTIHRAKMQHSDEQVYSTIVATYQNTFMVYSCDKLVWAAQPPTHHDSVAPVSIQVCSIGDVAGMIVMLDESLCVRVLYLGTEPPVHSVKPDDGPKLDYAAMDAEHRELLQVIREHTAAQRREPTEYVVIRSAVDIAPSELESVYPPDDRKWATNDRGHVFGIQTQLYVSYNGEGSEPIHDVNIVIQPPPGILCFQNTHSIASIGARDTPLVLDLTFGASTHVVPPSLQVNVAASYVDNGEQPRVVVHQFSLPLSLVCSIARPVKNTEFMLTLDTNAPPPSLMAIFPDMLESAVQSDPELARTSAAVVTFKFRARNYDVTILVSKKSGRYRLQGSSLCAFNLICESLCSRLRTHYNNNRAQEAFRISFSEKLPLDRYYTIIDSHYNYRSELRCQQTNIDRLSQQFRAFQKRILARLKSKNATPLDNLDELLNETGRKLVEGSKTMANIQEELQDAHVDLASATSLMLLLLQLKTGMEDATFSSIRSYLKVDTSSIDINALAQGWEERTDAALTHLLRTTLATKKSSHHQTAERALPTSIAFPADTSKLKKHIRQLCERLTKSQKVS